MNKILKKKKVNQNITDMNKQFQIYNKNKNYFLTKTIKILKYKMNKN